MKRISRNEIIAQAVQVIKFDETGDAVNRNQAARELSEIIGGYNAACNVVYRMPSGPKASDINEAAKAWANC